ncbi:MAG: VWA domain-containing protein, partial [Planctomycetes bacterium]|nr:VWA domain-containing protein [Planctomycetota bacterium]
VYFFTDMQHSTWHGTPGEDSRPDVPDKADAKKKPDFVEITDRASTIFVDCGPNEAPGNLAVTHLEFAYDNTAYLITGSDPDEVDEKNKGLTIVATVKNFGKNAANVRPELLIGRAKNAPGDNALQLRPEGKSEAEAIQPNAQHTFRFKHVFKDPGTYAVQVRIPDDALEPDNARTIIVTVRKDFPVLLVNGKTSADRLKGATDYVRLALNPFPRGESAWWTPVRPTVKTPEQFSDLTDADLAQYDCIFWCDVPKFGPNDAHKLDLFVRRGGGLIVSLGDESAENADLYNKYFHKDDHLLLPARLQTQKNVVDAADGHRFFMQTSDAAAYRRAPLAAFIDPGDQLVLRNSNFRKFVHAIPDHRANVVLSFMEETTRPNAPKVESKAPKNAPAILEWNPPWARAQALAPPTARPGQHIALPPARYRGKVILLTSTVNTDWTSWPSSPSFGAMIQELTRLAITGRLREQSQIVGGMLDSQIPGATETDITMAFPAELKLEPGKARTQVVDEVNGFRWADTDFAGIYRAEFGPAPKHEIPFAVNVPSFDQRGSESDLTRIEKNDLEMGYPGWKLQVVRDPLEGIVSGGPVNESAIDAYQPVGPTLANIALLIVLALMFAEIVMAWHFGHYTVTEGQVAETPGGPAGTAVAGVLAAVAVVVCGIGALVILHEKLTGDFLGFLPDIVRAWFEVYMEIPPPPAGEGRFWGLEPRPFLFGLPGPENWYAALIFLTALVVVFFIYKAEGPKVSLTFKLLLGVLRLCLILAVVFWLLPQYQQPFKRKSWPDLVILIDDTQSMSEPDSYAEGPVHDRVNKMRAGIRETVEKVVPERIRALTADIEKAKAKSDPSPEGKLLMESLEDRLKYWNKQKDDLRDGKWRPSRLQLAQAILAQPDPHWLKSILKKEQKIHIFHLDIHGRATKLRDLKGNAGDIIEAARIPRAEAAIAALEPLGNQSRLGTAVRQVIEQYAGSSLSSVIMFTDGVTTRDERLSDAARYAKQKNVALFFIGVGDESKARELKIFDLEVDDPIYLGDTAVFGAKVTANGFKSITVPVILKKLDKRTGRTEEIMREDIRVEDGRTARVSKLRHRPDKKGPHTYIIEIEPPPHEPGERPLPSADLRIERTIEVIDIEEIKVLYVEQQPRYEFRYIKFLMEREAPADKKKKKSIDLKVLLLDADPDFHLQDKHAIEHFPATLEELNKYQVLILGDCAPDHKKLQRSLKDIVAFVNGVDEKGKARGKPGGGI